MSNDNTLEAEAASLSAARRILTQQLPAGMEMVTEQILCDGARQTIRETGTSVETAMAAARAKMPVGSREEHDRVLSDPQFEALQIEAFDEQSAWNTAQLSISPTKLIASVALETRGRAGFLGIARRSHIFRVTVTTPVLVEVGYAPKARVRAVIGPVGTLRQSVISAVHDLMEAMRHIEELCKGNYKNESIASLMWQSINKILKNVDGFGVRAVDTLASITHEQKDSLDAAAAVLVLIRIGDTRSSEAVVRWLESVDKSVAHTYSRGLAMLVDNVRFLGNPKEFTSALGFSLPSIHSGMEFLTESTAFGLGWKAEETFRSRWGKSAPHKNEFLDAMRVDGRRGEKAHHSSLSIWMLPDADLQDWAAMKDQARRTTEYVMGDSQQVTRSEDYGLIRMAAKAELQRRQQARARLRQ
jgi:hypothetical protein